MIQIEGQDMAEPHPAASHHLPAFITAPGGTDVLMVVTGLFLALAVVMFGILFFRLLPTRSNSAQIPQIAV